MGTTGRPSVEGWKRRHHQVKFADELAPSQPTNPSMPLGEEGAQVGGSDLEEPLELKPMVASFLQGSLGTSDKEDEKMPPEPDTADFGQWIKWKLERCKHQIGGGNCWQYQGRKTPKGWLGRSGHLSHFHSICGSWTQWRPPFRLPLHCHISAKRSLCPMLTPSLHAGIFERS